MAAVDPIVYAQLCKPFPVLTERQVTNLCFYALGTVHQDASLLLGLAPSTIKKSLETSQKNVGLESVQDFKPVFWARFALKQICAKNGLNFYSLLNLDAINSLKKIAYVIPELKSEKFDFAILYTLGFSASVLANRFSLALHNVEETLVSVLELFDIPNLVLLRPYIASRLLLDLC
ncbi:hypothetical protein RN053_06795 [Pantoea dispersa]|uniref:hypothetical protein n=1 Tax=Enterobacterales TaxID=91347 RepID=UPI001E2DAEB3|nr:MULTISPECIES: hypothetical protein [Enterobacterales]MCE2003889.1 hypothetical protein [Enterobacter asburiae]MCI1029684.1 hypothetical protein [Pantoea dispersa]MDT8850187.1 hypothetical protein [Pantoea dispersa]